MEGGAEREDQGLVFKSKLKSVWLNHHQLWDNSWGPFTHAKVGTRVKGVEGTEQTTRSGSLQSGPKEDSHTHTNPKSWLVGGKLLHKLKPRSNRLCERGLNGCKVP